MLPLINFEDVEAGLTRRDGAAFEFDDGHAAIFEPQQAFLLQPLQALVGVLPRNAGERSDFFLCDLEMAGQVTDRESG